MVESKVSRYLRFKVQLQGIEPAMWRRFLLPDSASFSDLHRAIQDACGWENAHPFTFLEGGKSRRELLDEPQASSWSRVRLSEWFSLRVRARRSCIYWYDFGDDWMHEVELECVEEHAQDFGRRLLAGERSFPPEDCGGPSGYGLCARTWEEQRPSKEGAAKRDGEALDHQEWFAVQEPEAFDLERARRRFEDEKHSHREEVAICQPASGAGDLVDESGPSGIDLGPARKLALHVSRIVKAASLCAPGEHVTTGLACRRRPARRRCQGFLAVTREGECSGVEWCCSVCGDRGVISGWSGGSNDLRGVATLLTQGAPAGAEEQFDVWIPADVYCALLDEKALAIQSERLLYSARASAGQVVLRGSLDDIEVLYGECCADANYAARGVFRNRLDAACEILGLALESQVGAQNDEQEQAIVAEATRGLALTPEDLKALGLLVRESQSFLSGSGLDLHELLDTTLRETGESLLLQREIREVLAVRGVDYRHFPIFLRTLETTSAHIGEFARRARTLGLETYRRFLSGIGEIASNIHSDEDELTNFLEGVAREALDLSRRERSPSARLRPLITDLVNLWLADDCCAFYFVPDLIVGLGLGVRERNWLRKELASRVAGRSVERAADLEELGKRLA